MLTAPVRRTFAATLAALSLISVAPCASAAELKVISAGAVRGVLRGMIDDYSRQTGHTFNFTIGSTGQLRAAIASGEAADLIIASSSLMGELEQTGKMQAGSRVDLGRVGMGVVVRRGAALPDVATPEALKQALIAAKSIAYTDPKLGGVSYLHLMKLATGFGIAADVTAKGVDATGGDDAVAKVADGAAELAIVLISEIHSPGAQLVAPLPEPLQSWQIYAAAIPMSSREPERAREFVAALTGAAMRPRWDAAGWQLVVQTTAGGQKH